MSKKINKNSFILCHSERGTKPMLTPHNIKFEPASTHMAVPRSTTVLRAYSSFMLVRPNTAKYILLIMILFYIPALKNQCIDIINNSLPACILHGENAIIALIL